MSILNVEHLTHGFGDRAIFDDVSFRLLKGEHIGLVGANGEGKSTFMSIVTGKLTPDVEPKRSASAMISSLSVPMSGRKTGRSTAASVQRMLSSVCEAT